MGPVWLEGPGPLPRRGEAVHGGGAARTRGPRGRGCSVCRVVAYVPRGESSSSADALVPPGRAAVDWCRGGVRRGSRDRGRVAGVRGPGADVKAHTPAGGGAEATAVRRRVLPAGLALVDRRE